MNLHCFDFTNVAYDTCGHKDSICFQMKLSSKRNVWLDQDIEKTAHLSGFTLCGMKVSEDLSDVRK